MLCFLILTSTAISLLFLQKLLKKEHFLLQLFHIENDISKLENEVEAEKKSLMDVEDEQKNFNNDINMKKKEQAGYLKEMTSCEKRIAKKKIELDKKVCSTPLYH